MDAQERQELRELRDRLIRLETMIELEFKHMKEDWKIACESIHKLNEEYGRLLQKQADLETKFNKSIGNWKLAALVISPFVTTLIVLGVQYLISLI